MCLSLRGPMYVRSFACNYGTRRAIISKFEGAPGCPEMVVGAKMGGVMRIGQNIGVFHWSFGLSLYLSPDRPAKRHCRQIGHLALDTQAQAQALIEGVGADGLARILHTDTGSGGLEWAKSGTGLPM